MGYLIINWNPSQVHAKLHLRVATIIPDPLGLLECSLFQVLVFRASLPGFAKYILLILSCRVHRDGTPEVSRSN